MILKGDETAKRARIVARGFQQKDKVHYDSNDIAAPVVNDTTIKVVFVILLLAAWTNQLLDVKGAFLHGRFEGKEKLYTDVPQGMEKYYPKDTVLLPERTIYGLKQAAKQYWKEVLKCFGNMGYKRSKADPCLYYKWEQQGISIWMSWVDDMHVTGVNVMENKEELKKRFNCEDVGDVNEYVGCKIDRTKERIKFTQPVLIQSLVDEFDLPTQTYRTPMAEGTVLVESETKLNADAQSKYRSGVGKLLHLARWSRPEIFNAVRELTRFGGKAGVNHMKQMLRVMKYCVDTKTRGLTMNRTVEWNGDPDFEFTITGHSDSDYAKDPDTRHSVCGMTTSVNDNPVICKSKMMPVVALSVTEAELFAATACAQDMLFVMRIIESMGLKVKKPMILKVDNRGARDLINNWSVGGRTRHIETKQYFLREMKEAGIINVEWIPGDENMADLFTKNLGGPTFDKHSTKIVGPTE